MAIRVRRVDQTPDIANLDDGADQQLAVLLFRVDHRHDVFIRDEIGRAACGAGGNNAWACAAEINPGGLSVTSCCVFIKLAKAVGALPRWS